MGTPNPPVDFDKGIVGELFQITTGGDGEQNRGNTSISMSSDISLVDGDDGVLFYEHAGYLDNGNIFTVLNCVKEGQFTYHLHILVASTGLTGWLRVDKDYYQEIFDFVKLTEPPPQSP